jgi:hypothetical protein
MPVIFIVFGGALLSLALFTYLSDSIPGAAILCALALGYLIFGLALVRVIYLRRALPAWTLIAALALAVLEICNVYLEQFVGLASPANAIVPASFMATMVLTASIVAVLAASDGLGRGVFSSVVTIGAAMLVAVTSILIAVRIRVNGPAFADATLISTVSNASLHLTLPLFVALLAGTLAAAASIWAMSRGRQFCVMLSFAAVPALIVGVGLLVHAAGLPRNQRPPLVTAGMGACAIGLAVLPTFLAQKRRVGPTP